MLWTTAESQHERLPFADPLDGLAITADVRLDNRAELLSLLGMAADAASVTDSSLVLAAYRKWGDRCPEHLLGDFCFAIWDSATQTLFCACDHLGVRPLYYAAAPARFAFASEIDALLAVPGIARDLDEQMILDYLLPGTPPSQSRTFFKAIARLPAHHSLTVRGGTITLHPYWILDVTREVHFAADEEYEATFLDLFREAVDCRLRGTFTVGAMLSGGLDSSAVTAMASPLLAQSGREALHTYYLASETPSCDEHPFVQQVVDRSKTIQHNLPYLSPLTELDRLLDSAKALPLTLFYAASLHLFQTAQQNGVRVLLTGIDGDNTVGHGRAYLTELAAAQQWEKLTAEIRGLCQHFGGSPNSYLRRYVAPVLADWARQGQWRAFASGARAISREWDTSMPHLIWGYGVKPLVSGARCKAWDSVIRAEFRQRLTRSDPLERALGVREDQAQGLLSGSLQANFAEYDQIAGRAGIEVRHPFSDRRLVEFCLALPPEQKVRNGWMSLDFAAHDEWFAAGSSRLAIRQTGLRRSSDRLCAKSGSGGAAGAV